jgi:hypothetical protein
MELIHCFAAVQRCVNRVVSIVLCGAANHSDCYAAEQAIGLLQTFYFLIDYEPLLQIAGKLTVVVALFCVGLPALLLGCLDSSRMPCMLQLMWLGRPRAA